MNFILKDARQGLEIQVQSGRWYDANQTTLGDDLGLKAKGGGETDFKVAANLGLPLTEKGFINLSGEYTRNPELSRGIQHGSAIGVTNVQDPAMNWGRPKSSGFRGVWNAGLELGTNAKLYSFGNYADTYGN